MNPPALVVTGGMKMRMKRRNGSDKSRGKKHQMSLQRLMGRLYDQRCIIQRQLFSLKGDTAADETKKGGSST